MNSGTPELNFQYSTNQLTDPNGNLLSNQLFGGYISKDLVNNYDNNTYDQSNMGVTNSNEMNNNYTTTPMNVFNKSIDNSSPNSNISNSNSNSNDNNKSNDNNNDTNNENRYSNETSNQPNFINSSDITPTQQKLSTPMSNSGLSEEEIYQRRKAQNRAAQRAFRERKEGKLKELSGKLKEAELLREKLESQLNDLKEKNLLLGMENQMLQKRQNIQLQQTLPSSTFDSTTINLDKSPLTNSDNNNNNKNINNKINFNKELGFDDILLFKFPSTTKCDFIDGTIDWKSHGRSNESEVYANKIGESYKVDNEKVLTISAIWDYLVEFTNLNEDYTIDIPGIMSELRGKEVCHGFGPAYPLSLVNEIILKNVENSS